MRAPKIHRSFLRLERRRTLIGALDDAVAEVFGPGFLREAKRQKCRDCGSEPRSWHHRISCLGEEPPPKARDTTRQLAAEIRRRRQEAS